ncbi:hypothetical protein MSZK_48160 [Mycobacterium sp. shizuoka-1]|nr:hypothetical protein MSZK_48160 [Mycobacterium sp. shizuoka-1]
MFAFPAAAQPLLTAGNAALAVAGTAPMAAALCAECRSVNLHSEDARYRRRRRGSPWGEYARMTRRGIRWRNSAIRLSRNRRAGSVAVPSAVPGAVRRALCGDATPWFYTCNLF